MNNKKILITGTGGALPKKIVTNQELPKELETSHEWILERTGISQRHICSEEETTSSLSILAAKQALEASGIEANQIDFIVVGTSSPDYSFPSVATQVQAGLGINNNCPSFDVSAACSGFIYALSMAENFLRCNKGKKALVIGADNFSNLVDWKDRNTCVLFGDGAGAVILEASEVNSNATVTDNETHNDRGIIGTEIFSDGKHVDLLRSDGGVSTTRTSGSTQMKGREVFRHAVRAMSEVIEETLEKYQVSRQDVDWLVPHQANLRIIEATAKILDTPMEKVIVTVDKHANTSAASVPLALDHGIRSGKIKTGDLVFMEAFGAGFTWGATLVRI